MSPITDFKTLKVTYGARIKIVNNDDPENCVQTEADVFIGNYPVLTVLLFRHSGSYCWISSWSIDGGHSRHNITLNDFADLMRWPRLQAEQEAGND